MEKFQVVDGCFINFYGVQDDDDYPGDGILIDLIQTDTDAQGQGLARQTLQAFLEKHDGHRVYLVCCPKDRQTRFGRLVEFYQSEGFDISDGAENMPYPLMER